MTSRPAGPGRGVSQASSRTSSSLLLFRVPSFSPGPSSTDSKGLSIILSFVSLSSGLSFICDIEILDLAKISQGRCHCGLQGGTRHKLVLSMKRHLHIMRVYGLLFHETTTCLHLGAVACISLTSICPGIPAIQPP